MSESFCLWAPWVFSALAGILGWLLRWWYDDREFNAYESIIKTKDADVYLEMANRAYTFLVEDEKLIARHSRHPDFELRPVKSDYFSANIWFAGQIEFVRNQEGAVSGCKVSSGRVRNLWFEKQ